MATIDDYPMLDNLHYNEEIFCLRAQDMTAPDVVLQWIIRNLHSAPEAKLREAFECAMRMRDFTHAKQPIDKKREEEHG